MVREIQSKIDFDQTLNYQGLVVVDFFADWCGPCKAIAPFLDELAGQHPEVVFVKVDVEKHKDDIPAAGSISSLPTFHFYVAGQLKETLKGANRGGIEEYVKMYKVNPDPFANSTGHKLASPGDAPAMSAREARLKAFAAVGGAQKKASTTPPALPSTMAAAAAAVDEEDEALAKAMALSLAESSAAPAASPAAGASSSSIAEAGALADAEFVAAEAAQDAEDKAKQDAANTAEWGEEMVPVPVDEGILVQLVEMGFTDVRARKAIVHGTSLEGAMNWLTEHQDDPDIDQPYMVRKADTIPKKPLTEEEKAERSAQIKARIKAQKEAKAKQEKEDAIRKEKERRERDAKMQETQEERARLQRKRDADKQAREKKEAEKERQRLRAEIARDKELRRLNKGVLPSVLGVDGYNPAAGNDASALAAKNGTDGAVSSAAAASAAAPVPAPAVSAGASSALPAKRPSSDAGKQLNTAKKTSSTGAAVAANMDPKQKIDTAIATLMRYRTGGDGGSALKLLLTFCKNIDSNPTEAKYRSVNPESGPFKAKLAPFVGPMALLKAVGFEKSEEDGKLKFEGVVPGEVLSYAVAQLAAAEELYRQQNA